MNKEAQFSRTSLVLTLAFLGILWTWDYAWHDGFNLVRSMSTDLLIACGVWLLRSWPWAVAAITGFVTTIFYVLFIEFSVQNEWAENIISTLTP